MANVFLYEPFCELFAWRGLRGDSSGYRCAPVIGDFGSLSGRFDFCAVERTGRSAARNKERDFFRGTLGIIPFPVTSFGEGRWYFAWARPQQECWPPRNSTTHQGEPLPKLLRQHPRLSIEHFPSYAPELNPDEGVWSLAKRELANSCPKDVDELMEDILRSIEAIRSSPEKLRGCILQSELPSFLR
jgi:DDE superfamily endonuclease